MAAKIQFKSVRARMTFLFLTVALLPLIIVSIIIYNQRVTSIKDEAFLKLTAIRDLKVQQVNIWVDERIGDINTISEDFEIRSLEKTFQKAEYNQDDIELVANARRLLSRYLKNYQDYHEVFIVNHSSGKVEISTDKSQEGADRSKDPSFTEPMLTKRPYIRDIYYSKALSMPSMSFSVPIYGAAHDEKIIGILVVRIDLKRSLYVLLLDRSGMGKTGETLIVNKDAVALNKLRWYERAPLRLKIEAEPAVNASRGKTGITETVDYRGEKILAAYTYLPETRWGFVAKQDIKEIYAPIQELIKNILVLLVFSAVAVYILAFFSARNTARPIFNMTKTSRKIQEGDFSARNQVVTADELGFLALSFNDMADTITSRMQVERHVSELTETMVTAEDLSNFGSELLKKLMEISGSELGSFYLLNEDKNSFEHLSSIGVNSELLKPFDASMLEGEFGKALATKKITHIKNIPENTLFKFKTFAGTALPKEIITIPIVVRKRVLAVASLASLIGYSEETIETLNLAWLGMNTALSNLMASVDTQRLADELSIKNQELEAQSAELQSLNEELKHQSKELEEQNVELTVQRAQVEEANRLKSEFLSNMSHELRTPLNSIMALSNVLATQIKDKLSEEEGSYLEIIERNGRQLLSLINDILDLSKIEAGRMDVSISKFFIGATISTLVESIAPLAGEKGIEIVEKLPEDLPMIESDEIRIHQVLQNIIGNAVKFTEKGSVTVSAYNDNDPEKIHITIKDTGIGISKKDLPFIFQEFRQIDGSTSRQFEGTGLGLAIAKRALEMLGGEISVVSEVDKGSTFTVVLPVKWKETTFIHKTVAQEFITKMEPERKTIPVVDDESNVLTRFSGSAKRILLVEDNDAAVIQIKSTLESGGYILDVAQSGEEALAYVRHTKPDGIILDLMMPGMDGFEVLEEIRSTRETAELPVLVLTAKDLTPEELKKLSANNIRQLIQKGDVDRQGLLVKIKMMLGAEEKAEPEPPVVISKNQMPIPETAKKQKIQGTPTILVVEDNPDNMITIKAILRNHYKLLEATDGEEGLNKALTESPDLILLDISLPKLDGYTVVRKVRENKTACNIPVIGLTAHAMEGDREKIMEAGCNDYMSKPIDPAEALKKIEKYL